MIRHHGVSVVAVNPHDNLSNNKPLQNHKVSQNKTPSLFNKIFSRNSSLKQPSSNITLQNGPTIQPTSIVLSHCKPSTDTTPQKLGVVQLLNEATNPSIITDLCSKCHMNPPQMSLANSRGMTAEKLCSGCHILTQKSSKSRALKNDFVSSDDTTNIVIDVNIPSQKTLIVMQSNGLVSNPNTTKDTLAKDTTEEIFSNKVSVVQPFSNFRAVEKNREAPKENILLSLGKPQISKLSFHSSFRRGESKPNFQGQIVSSDIPIVKTSSVDTGSSPISEFSAPTFNCRPAVSNIPECDFSFSNPCDSDNENIDSNEILPIPAQPSNTFNSQNPLSSDRPMAFNPDYRGTLRTQQTVSIEIPNELEVAPATQQFSGKVEEMMHNDLLEHQRIMASEADRSFSMAPPRYEDIVKELPQETCLDSYPLNLIQSFGKSSSQAQPGGFRHPTFIKFSSHHGGNDGVVVVTDPSLNNLQVFERSGKCLTMMRIDGLVCGCMITKNTLLVAFANKVAIFRYDGTEKSCMDVATTNQNEVKAVTRFKNNPSFAVLAQRKTISVLDCSFQNVLLVKKFNAAGPRKIFINIADVALTNKDDIVVLDAGDNDASIYIIGTASGQLKTAIYPKHESCGLLLSPSSISLDPNNRIIITNPSEKKILIISFRSPRENISGNKIIVRQLSGMVEDKRPLGLDVADSGAYFIILKGEEECVVSVFSVV